MGGAAQLVQRLGLAMVLLLALAGLAPAVAGNRAVLVLDASASMWGRIDGIAKFQIARKAIVDLMSRWDKGTELGLTLYGHRTSGVCSDIQDLVKIGPVSAKKIRTALAKIRPKGKTPMTAAVKHAAEALDYTRRPATVILLSDGQETCDLDPCKVAAALEQDGKALTVHVIGFDIKEAKTKAELTCLADQTGGTLTLVDSAVSLASALTAVAALTAGTAAAAPPAAVEPETPPPAPPPPAVPQAPLTFKATLGKDGPAVTAGLFWGLYREDAAPRSPDSLGALVAKSYDEVWQPPVIVPGRYVLVATLGDTTTRQIIEVTSAPQTVSVVIEAGIVTAQATEVQGGPPITAGLSWRVASATQPRVAYGYAAAPRFIIPPGPYVMHVTYGGVTAEQPFAVKLGETAEIAMVLGSGLLKLQARPAAEAPAATQDVAYSVYPEGAPQRVAHGYDATGQFRLAAGRYRVVANLGEGSAEQVVDLAAGTVADVTLVVGVGTLKVAARPAPDAAPATGGVTWKIYPEGADQRRAASDQASPQFTLPIGRYRVVAELGKARIEQSVEIAAGRTVEADLVLNVGTVAPTAIYAPDAPKPREGLNWTLFGAARGADGKRSVLASSSELTPGFVVPAGLYLLVVEAGLAHGEKPVEVKAGETVTPDFDLQAGSIIAEATAGGATLREGLGWDLLRKVESLTGDVLEGLGSNYDARPVWIVPAGRYMVRVGRGETTREVEVTVTAGKPSRVTLSLD